MPSDQPPGRSAQKPTSRPGARSRPRRHAGRSAPARLRTSGTGRGRASRTRSTGSSTTRSPVLLRWPRPPHGPARPGRRRTARGSSWPARSAAPGRCRRCRPGSVAGAPSPRPGSGGGSVSVQLQPRHPAAGQRREPSAEADAAPARSAPMPNAQAQAAMRSGQRQAAVSPSVPGARCADRPAPGSRPGCGR